MVCQLTYPTTKKTELLEYILSDNKTECKCKEHTKKIFTMSLSVSLFEGRTRVPPSADTSSLIGRRVKKITQTRS